MTTWAKSPKVWLSVSARNTTCFGLFLILGTCSSNNLISLFVAFSSCKLHFLVENCWQKFWTATSTSITKCMKENSNSRSSLDSIFKPLFFYVNGRDKLFLFNHFPKLHCNHSRRRAITRCRQLLVLPYVRHTSRHARQSASGQPLFLFTNHELWSVKMSDNIRKQYQFGYFLFGT